MIRSGRTQFGASRCWTQLPADMHGPLRALYSHLVPYLIEHVDSLLHLLQNSVNLALQLPRGPHPARPPATSASSASIRPLSAPTVLFDSVCSRERSRLGRKQGQPLATLPSPQPGTLTLQRQPRPSLVVLMAGLEPVSSGKKPWRGIAGGRAFLLNWKAMRGIQTRYHRCPFRNVTALL